MKKKHKLALCFSIAAVVIGSTIALSIGQSENLFIMANEGYQLKFDNVNNPLSALATTEEEIKQPYCRGDYFRQPVKTMDNHDGIVAVVEGGFVNPTGALGLTNCGSISNEYSKTQPYHGRINGLKNITVHYVGGPLTVSYGYEESMALGQYQVTCQELKSGVPYNFDNNYPQYFQIATQTRQLTYIEDITVNYSCNQINQKLPDKPFYDSGYHVGAIQGRQEYEQAYQAVVHSDNEALFELERAALLHYQFAKLTYDYEPIGAYGDVYEVRRSFSHVIFLPSDQPWPTTKGEEMDFILVYEGDRTVNYDDLGTGVDSGEYGFVNHYDIASMFKIPTIENTATELSNANNAIRLKYAKDHNLLRNKNYNDFAIEKLPDEKYIDVYNSEDLWWAALYGYKPRFPLPNSKAEWIYNCSKQILNSIIYTGMSNFEKIRAIFEWIIENNQYDLDALDSGRDVEENTCYFLEGVFERHLAVCDGFSKTFCLLASMEGLDVKRGIGSSEDQGAHAWAYARCNPSEDYFLVCPTWGHHQINFAKEPEFRNLGFVDYEAFMTSKHFFFDASGQKVDFPDERNIDLPLSETIYSPSIYTLDKLAGYTNYDAYIESSEEYAAWINAACQACPDGFTFSYVLKDNAYESNLYIELEKYGITPDTYNIRVRRPTLYGVTSNTIFVFPI